jgi:hypothetical protein
VGNFQFINTITIKLLDHHWTTNDSFMTRKQQTPTMILVARGTMFDAEGYGRNATWGNGNKAELVTHIEPPI